MTTPNKKIERIIENYKQGYSVRDNAKDCHVDKNTAQKYINQYLGRPVKKKQTIPKIVPGAKTIFTSYDQTIFDSHGWIDPSQVDISNEYQNNNLYPHNQMYEKNNQDAQEQKKPSIEEIEIKKLDEQIKQVKKYDENHRKVMGEIDKLIQKTNKNKAERKKKAEIEKLKYQMDCYNIKFNNFKRLIESRNKPITQITPYEKTNDLVKEMKPMKLIPLKDSKQEQIGKQENKVIRKQVAQDGEQKKNNIVLLPVTEPTSNNEKDQNPELENDEFELPSDLIAGVLNGLAKTAKKLIDFSNTPDGKIPKNSPEYWKKLSEYLKNNN